MLTMLLSRSRAYRILFFLLLALMSLDTCAWVYPEHRRISLLAIQYMDNNYRTLLERIWTEARGGYESRLPGMVILPAQGRHPAQLDYAAWTAIAGDHSCSSENLLYNVLQTEWIFRIADIGAELDNALTDVRSPSRRANSLHLSDLRLQRADEEYATRARSNNVHFPLARTEATMDIHHYLSASLAKGSDLNAVGAYAWYHTSALQKAALYATMKGTAKERSTLLLAMLADEAFALHFLQDMFAAGHIAGTWGSTAVRKGTHDYYNEKGLEISTWDGRRMVLMGDGYMRPEDAAIAARTVQQSLEQMLDAAIGKRTVNLQEAEVGARPDSLNVCLNVVNPIRSFDNEPLIEIIRMTPMPGLATGLGELPRFRAEIGRFFGFASSLNGSTVYGGFASNQTQQGVVVGVEANVRFGFGLEGVLNESGDGVIFVQAGWKINSSSTSQFANLDASAPTGQLTAAIPGRSAYNLRLRCPFYAIPGDLLLLAPVLLLTSPSSLTRMAAVAANGGLLPWQSGIMSGIGRFQLMVGREVGVSFYGLNTPRNQLFVTGKNNEAMLINYKSTEWDFPFLEYRPFRTFSNKQTSSMIVQFSFGFDKPYGVQVVSPAGNPRPELRTIWHTSTKIVFAWRHYH